MSVPAYAVKNISWGIALRKIRFTDIKQGWFVTGDKRCELEARQTEKCQLDRTINEIKQDGIG